MTKTTMVVSAIYDSSYTISTSTNELKWINEILHQKYIVKSFDGFLEVTEEVWREVPRES